MRELSCGGPADGSTKSVPMGLANRLEWLHPTR